MSITDQFSDQSILARTIWGENRGGGEEGMTSVANVVINRVAQPGWWGMDIRSVCLKPEQFSCWNANDPNYPLIMAVDEANSTFALAMDIAAQAIGGTLSDITNGATSYYALSMAEPPYWATGKTPCATIQNQLFFS